MVEIRHDLSLSENELLIFRGDGHESWGVDESVKVLEVAAVTCMLLCEA